MAATAIDVWQYRNENATTFTLASAGRRHGDDKAGGTVAIVDGVRGNMRAARSSREGFAATIGGGGGGGAVAAYTRNVVGVVGGGGNRMHHHHQRQRGLLTPLVEDVSPPRRATRTLLQPLPESAVGTLAALRGLGEEVAATMITDDDSAANNCNGDDAKRVRRSWQATSTSHRDAAELLTELSILEQYVPPAAMQELLAPASTSNDFFTDVSPLPSMYENNPHGEAICYVGCSAAVGKLVTAGAAGSARTIANTLSGDGGEEHCVASAYPSREFAVLAADFGDFGDSSRSDATSRVMGLPPPHSLVRRSRKGLAADTVRHDVPVREGTRRDRALLFLAQLKDAAAVGGGITATATTTARGGAATTAALAASGATFNALPSSAARQLALLDSQWTAVDTHTAEQGFEVHTVTATTKADRQGHDRFFHKYEGGRRVAPTANQQYTKGPSNAGASFAVGSALERNRLNAMQSRVLIPTDAPSYRTEMSERDGPVWGEQHRRRGQQQQRARPNEREPGDGLNNSGGMYGPRGTSSPSRIRHGLDDGISTGTQARRPSSPSTNSTTTQLQRELELAALMGDMVEVKDYAFKITAMPAPTLRRTDALLLEGGMGEVVAMIGGEGEGAERVVRSQRELARSYHLGGTLCGK